MKRKICLVLTLVLVVFALSACGKADSGKKTDDGSSQPQSTEKVEEKR